MTRSFKRDSFFKFDGNSIPSNSNTCKPVFYDEEYSGKHPSLLPVDKRLNALAMWMLQVWLPEANELPLLQSEIDDFDVEEIMNKFSDWFDEHGGSKLPINTMASLDEMIIIHQLIFTRQKIHTFLNDDLLGKKPETEYVYPKYLNSVEMSVRFLDFVMTKSSINTMLVSDGLSFHVMTSIGFEPELNAFIFKDNIGEKGKCYLSKENNKKGFDAKLAIHDALGNWVWTISFQELSKVLYGVLIPHSRLKLWQQTAIT
ncbi:MAG: hypothetical protein MK088_15305 [Alteromonas sp.]|mgnify:CR=1 FL=1|nr:hypothetical protein [Alteromonas sp.]